MIPKESSEQGQPLLCTAVDIQSKHPVAGGWPWICSLIPPAQRCRAHRIREKFHLCCVPQRSRSTVTTTTCNSIHDQKKRNVKYSKRSLAKRNTVHINPFRPRKTPSYQTVEIKQSVSKKEIISHQSSIIVPSPGFSRVQREIVQSPLSPREAT
jgi:hypothetical protein